MFEQFVLRSDSVRFFCQVAMAWRNGPWAFSVAFSQYTEHAEIDVRRAADFTAIMRCKISTHVTDLDSRYFSSYYLSWARLLLPVFEPQQSVDEMR